MRHALRVAAHAAPLVHPVDDAKKRAHRRDLGTKPSDPTTIYETQEKQKNISEYTIYLDLTNMKRKRLNEVISGYNKYSGVRITRLSSKLHTREQAET